MASPSRSSRRKSQCLLRKAVIDALEPRRLLAATLDVNGLLTIDGTNGDDVLAVSVADGQLTVLLNGSPDGSPFDLASITSIVINGNEGNDNLSLAGTSIPGVINGGNGTDTLTGGGGSDVLNGRNGDDSFISNDGVADTLDGGNGNDSAVADNSLDTFISIESGVPVPVPRISVAQGANPIIDGSVTPIDFGTVTQGKSGPVIVFTVTNDGDDSLTLGAPTLPAGYTLIDPLTGPLAPGTSDTFSIRLDSGIVGTKAGEVSIANTDPNQNPFNFQIIGIVQPSNDPAMTVTLARPAGPIDNGNSAVEFGNRTVSTRGPTRTFRVRNDGTADLDFGSISLPAGFTLVDGLAGPLAPGGAESFTIALDTSKPGNFDGFVSIATNDSRRNPFTIRLIGVVGVDSTPLPEITVKTIQNKQYRGVATGSSNFSLGTATAGGASTARTFIITNDGAANLNLGAVSVPAGFTIVDPLLATLKPGQTDFLVIGMSTKTVGSKSGIVSFSTNDNNENPFSIGVFGTVSPATGVGPAVTASLANGTLTVNGTNGIDTISFTSSSRGITVIANSKSVAGSPFRGVGKIVVSGNDGDDRIVADLPIPATLLGGNGNDTLIGGTAADRLDGGAGSDVLDSGDGNDTLLGGIGNDVLTGGLGLDSMLGGDGNDTINAADGLSDTIVDGGAGSDTIHKDRTDTWTGT